MNRGAIVLVSAGQYVAKPRPALIIQDMDNPTGESVVVIHFTTTENPEIHLRVQVNPTKENGLDRPCFLEVDKISAIRRSTLSKTVGRLEKRHVQKVEEHLRALLSLQE
jgi:mRNA interferase MazF